MTAPKINKMAQAISIMRSIKRDLNIAMAVKSPEANAKFKARVKTELLMSDSGANTYCLNVNTFLAGGDPYASNKRANNKRRLLQEASGTDQTATKTVTVVETVDGQFTIDKKVDAELRWWAVNPNDHKVIGSFPARELARTFANATGVVWKDRTKFVIAQ